MTSAWWTSLSIIAAATTSSPKVSPAKGLLEVTMREARSYRAETSWKNRLAASALERDVADFVDDDQRVAAQPG
jgi:hypothetical protein